MSDLFVAIHQEGEEEETWGGYDFSRPSRAVIVKGTRDDGCVLYTVGAHVHMEQDEGGFEYRDLGFVDAPDGVSVWVGKSCYVRAYDCDEFDGFRGTYRAPTPEEWAAIQRGECPWDDDDWLETTPREAWAKKYGEE